MLGIGGKLEKKTKIKILAEKARQYNAQYDNLISQGFQPQQAARQLQKEQYARRHQFACQEEPYKNSKNINPLGGTVDLGYTQNHKVKSTTKTMFEPMETRMMESKANGMSASIKRTPQQQKEFNKMKQRIHKDHLNEDFDINFGGKMESDYKKNFKNNEKMKEICETRDCKYNQRKNQLLWYAETYIRTKDSLRKC